VRTPTDKKGKEVEGSWAKVDHVLLGNGSVPLESDLLNYVNGKMALLDLAFILRRSLIVAGINLYKVPVPQTIQDSEILRGLMVINF